MKLVITTIIISLFMIPAMAQSGYDRSKDSVSGGVVMKGELSIDDLVKEPEFDWARKRVEEYKPQAEAMKQLKAHLEPYNIVVVMGTWCEDSQVLVPQLIKVLAEAGVDMYQKVRIFGLDRAKTGKNLEERIYNVSRVPTIIVYKGHAEQGRITESVSKSIEQDLAHIVNP
jgi:thiol-disulfide isomerase/thioredoxin